MADPAQAGDRPGTNKGLVDRLRDARFDGLTAPPKETPPLRTGAKSLWLSLILTGRLAGRPNQAVYARENYSG